MLRVLKLDRFLASFTYTGAPTPGRTLFYQQYLAGAPTPGWTIFYQLYLHWGPLLGYTIYINITYILLRIDQTFIQKMDVLWPKKLEIIPCFPSQSSLMIIQFTLLPAHPLSWALVLTFHTFSKYLFVWYITSVLV